MNKFSEEEQRILNRINETIEKNTKFNLDIAKIQIENTVNEDLNLFEKNVDEEENKDGK